MRRPSANSRLDAEPLEHVADLRPAAMHDHRIDRGLLQQHDVAREALRGRFVAHGVAAVLHHDGLLVVALHVRQRLGRGCGPGRAGWSASVMSGLVSSATAVLADGAAPTTAARLADAFSRQSAYAFSKSRAMAARSSGMPGRRAAEVGKHVGKGGRRAWRCAACVSAEAVPSSAGFTGRPW